MIYDNITDRDVMAELATKMTNRGFDPQRVTMSSVSGNIPAPANAGYSCNTIYGDSALLQPLSALTSAIAGGKFGVPQGLSGSTLGCGGTLSSSLPSLKTGHPPRTVVDVHASIGSDRYPAASQEATFANNYYNQLWNFVQIRLSGQAHKVVLGETGPVDNYGCSPYPYQWADAWVNGPGGGYVSSTLFQNDKANVVLRPWLSTAYQNGWCTLYPNVLNPPYKVN